MAANSKLIQEAIAEVRDLKAAAEQNAKNAIIEALTPRLREMIESEIAGKDPEDSKGDLDGLLFDTASSVVGDQSGTDPAAVGSSADKAEAAHDALTAASPATPLPDNLDDEIQLGEAAKRELQGLKKATAAAAKGNIFERALSLHKRNQLIKEMSRSLNESSTRTSLVQRMLQKMISEADSLLKEVIHSREKSGDKHRKTDRVEQVIKETFTMAKRLAETEVKLKLTLPDDLDVNLDSLSAEIETPESEAAEEPMDLDFGGDEEGGEEIPNVDGDLDLGDDEDLPAETNESSLRERDEDDEELDLGDDAGEAGGDDFDFGSLDFGGDEGDVPDADGGEEDLGMMPGGDLEIKIHGLPDDLDLSTAQVEIDGTEDLEGPDTEMEDLDMAGGESEDDEDSDDESADEDDDDLEEGAHDEDPSGYRLEGDEMSEDVYEIDESELAAALSGLSEGDATDPKVVKAFGGGKKVKEMFVDATDDDINVNEAVRKNAALVKESKILKNKLSESTKTIENLTKRLTEMNLFSAKLLAVNKLLQRGDISSRQQKSIVQAIDKSKTLREVKLLYKGLTESLARRAKGNGESLNESTQRKVPGRAAASKPVGSPGPSAELLSESTNASYSQDRWATLAGISSESKNK